MCAILKGTFTCVVVAENAAGQARFDLSITVESEHTQKDVWREFQQAKKFLSLHKISADLTTWRFVLICVYA